MISSSVLTPLSASTMSCQFRPKTAPRYTRTPYQIADAAAIGTAVRQKVRRVIPAKTGTRARNAGRNRLAKMILLPCALYRPANFSSCRGLSSQRPAAVVSTSRP